MFCGSPFSLSLVYLHVYLACVCACVCVKVCASHGHMWGYSLSTLFEAKSAVSVG